MIYNESYTSLEFIFKVFGKCGCRLNFPVAFWVTDSKYLNMLPMPVFTNSPHCQLSWFFPLKGFQVFDKSKYGQIPKYNHTFLITMNLKLKLNKLTRISSKSHKMILYSNNIWIFLLPFLMIIHQSNNYQGSRGLFLTNHKLMITYNL